MNWKIAIKGYQQYLQLEKGLSENSVDAYLADVTKLEQYSKMHDLEIKPQEVSLNVFETFLAWIVDIGLSAHSQARIISGIKGFYKYLILEKVIDENPLELCESPKLGRKLPDTLEHNEVNQIIDAIDLSIPENTRNKAIIETMYSSGLRVSEIVNFLLSGIYWEEQFIRVIGKGNKERLVPIGSKALKSIKVYVESVRNHQVIQSGNEDFVFLNRRGRHLSRVMIFNIVKDLSLKAGIKKKVSPHTFRHSFATSLVENGADLRAVQEMLGHESITTTEIYTHLNREYLRDEFLQYHPLNK